MNAALLWTTLRAETRGARGRMAFVGGCLSVGVAAVTGVSALTGAIQDGIAARSRILLGADFSIEARRPLPADLGRVLDEVWAAAHPGAGAPERVDVLEMATLAGTLEGVAGELPRSLLTELKVVGEGWPLYGAVRFAPPVAIADLGPERCAVGTDLLVALDLTVGERLRLGGVTFEIAAEVLEEPDDLGFSFQAGPRVLITRPGLERTSLIDFGSRVEHKALIRLPGNVPNRELRRLTGQLEEALSESHWLSFRTHDRAQPSLRRGLRQIERYLGLSALLSLLLGAAGVAQVVRAWLAQRTASIAILRALGWRPRDVLALFLTQVGALALIASALGAAFGSLAPLALRTLAPELLPEGLLRIWQPLAVGRGLLMGTGVALFFALVPLLAVGRISPAFVLRAEAEPLLLPRAMTWGATTLAAGSVFAAAWLQGGELEEALWFSGGLAVLAGLLWVASRALARLARALPRERFPPALTHGIAALGRPSSGTTGAIVALGVGVLVVVAMQLIESRLQGEFASAIPQEAPTVFLVDVQPDQAEALHAMIASGGSESVDEVPVVTARLAAIDGVPVSELRRTRDGKRRSRWRLTREQRLTWMRELPGDNVIVDGSLWSDPDVFEVSLEEEFAEGLGAEVGTRLAFDVQGIVIELTVTSLRTVEWRSFNVNFFLVAEPGALEGAPHMVLTTARLSPADEERVQLQTLRDFPNVTVLRVRSILERVAEIFERLAQAVRGLGLLTVLAGLAILAGVAAASAAHRAGEVALYKTLGVTRRGIAVLFATEYALCGLVAGAIGGAGGLLLAHTFLRVTLELPPELSLASVPVAALLMAVLSAVAGLAASARALAVPPLASLRR